MTRYFHCDNPNCDAAIKESRAWGKGWETIYNERGQECHYCCSDCRAEAEQ